MRHPNEGVLRRLLDEPAGVAEADRQHVSGCTRCLDNVSSLQRDAVLVGAALSTAGGAEPDVDAAWRRLSAATTVPAKQGTASSGSARSRVLRRPAAAALAAVVVLAGAGTAAANDWLPVFRTERVAAVSITTADLLAMPDLSAYGVLDVTSEPNLHEVRDAAVAKAESGLDLPAVADLPKGVTGAPTYQVGGKVAATFTFSAERAGQAAAAAGEALPPAPPGLDGSSVRLVAGPGVAQVWSSSAGVPALVVGRATAPTAFSSGVPFETARDYLLSLPGLPEDVAAQLRTFAADGSTLPLPVPAERVTTSSEQVNGVPATLLVSRDRTMAAVVWVQNSVVTVVAGSLDDDEVLSVAKELR